MFDYIHSIIACLLISVSTFVSPVKYITPTPVLVITITITPKVTLTVTPAPTVAVVQPQAQTTKCQFDREGFINKARELSYSEEEINTYLSAHPGNCMNITNNTSGSNQVQNYIESQAQQNLQNQQPTVYVPKNKSCYQSGDYTICSDGTSFITNGNTTFIHGNEINGSCMKNGIYTSCSDGSSAIQNGNTTFIHGNGTSVTCSQNGVWLLCSDGSSTYSP